jgi:asparagine synthase (glutamine-hydrolysing)
MRLPESSFAGAVGAGASKFLSGRLGDASPAKEVGNSQIFTGEGARMFSDDTAACIVLGTPRFDGSGNTNGPERKLQIDEWRCLLDNGAAEMDAQLHGHFAGLIIDFSGPAALLVTDRFGSYALYYRIFPDGIAVADRADVLLDSDSGPSDQALFDYLYFHCLPGPGTVNDSVKRLEPGSAVRWQNGRLSEETYWCRRARGERYTSFEEAKKDFHQLLRKAVEDEFHSGNIGAFLSGGTDSSTVVGLLAERSVTPVKSYSIGFDVEGYDEAYYAKLAAKHFGSQHSIYYVTPDDLVARLHSIAESLDQPFGNSSLAPAIICAERALDDGITKLLAGDGGDELFGGNTRYARQRIFGLYESVPELLRRGLIEPLVGSPLGELFPVRKLRNYVKQAQIPMPDRLESYNLLEREGIGNIFPESLLERVDAEHPCQLQRKVWSELSAGNLIDRMLEFDWKFTLADNDLRKVRYASDFAGIDVGFPLLSDKLAEFSLRLAPEWKVRGFKLRWFFKEALSDFLPTEIIQKKKHGFGLPFGSWVCEHSELREMAADALMGLSSRGIVNGAYTKSLIEQRLPRHPYYYGEMVWILMMLELWLRAHSPNWRV